MGLTPHINHPWNVSPEEAQQLQDRYRQAVIISPLPAPQQNRITAIASAANRDRVFAVAITVYRDKPPYLEITVASAPLTFPYQSGFLAFHQAPAILQAIAQLNRVGNVIVVNGHGLAHPRRCGLASHLGVLLDYPTIGLAQSLLPGNHIQPSDDPHLEWVADADGTVGIAVYAQKEKKPLFLSIGHRTDVPSLIDFSRLWMGNYRQPEAMRIARQFLREHIRKIKE